MALMLYYHPFSSYSWKVLIPLYEAGIPFEAKTLEKEEASAEWRRLWPIGRFPLLVDPERGHTLPEASVIIEYLDTHHPGPTAMLPKDEESALQVRLLDRFFDNYIQGSLQKIVSDRLRAQGHHDGQGVEEAQKMLGAAYAWLEKHLAGHDWAVGKDFTMADCAAAPALFYADWVHPIGSDHPNVTGYRARLLARASVKRVIDEARPYRSYFPGGAPDRD